MGDATSGLCRLSFNPQLRVEFRGATVTSDAGLLWPRELDERLGLGALIERPLRAGRASTPLASILRGRHAWLESAQLTQQRKREEKMGPDRESRFNGALAVGRAAGGSLEQAIPLASAAAALTCVKRGAQDSLPDRADVERFLKNLRGD